MSSRRTPPILLVHGIRTSASMWRYQVERLQASGCQVLAIDLPGHGARIGEEFTVTGALEAIDAGVSALSPGANAEPVLLVGLSLGGYYAMAYAAQYPQRVLGLVAAGCSAIPRGPLLTGYRVLARIIHRLPDRGLWLHNILVRRMLPPAGARDALAGGVALEVMDAGLRATGTLRPLRDLRRYPGRVWLVNGARDHFRLNEKRFLAACSQGTRVVIPRATHLVSLARPEAFTTVLDQVALLLAGERAHPIVEDRQ